MKFFSLKLKKLPILKERIFKVWKNKQKDLLKVVFLMFLSIFTTVMCWKICRKKSVLLIETLREVRPYYITSLIE